MSSRQNFKIPADILALNYFSFVFLGAIVSLAIVLGKGLAEAFFISISLIYLLPPLFGRIVISFFGKPSGLLKQEARSYRIWWALMQFQLIFNRFEFLENILKIVPGLYSLWLNLWGAKVSPFVFWSPGVTVMDRYHLHIQKGVILGTQSLISGHALKLNPDGSTLLIVDPVKIETGALIGARAMIAPGCHIFAHETVASQKILKPYTSLRDGKKTRRISNQTLYENHDQTANSLEKNQAD